MAIKISFYLQFLFFFNPVCSQTTKIPSQISESSIINKWCNSVINLEGKSNFFISKLWVDGYRKVQSGIYSSNYIRKLQDSISKTRYSGTGIFFEHNNKYYILTARHVIEDTLSVVPDMIYDMLFLRPNGSNILDKIPIEDDSNFVHYLQFIGGSTIKKQYIYSDKETDLAIISLNDIPLFGMRFIRTLIRKGYIPIHISDIDTSQSMIKDDKIICLGFPSFSEIDRQRFPNDRSHLSSWLITIPVATKGTIDEIMKNSIYFKGNIFTYHGFSGGPVIYKNKLIGIIHAYRKLPTQTNNPLLKYYFLENSIFTKSNYLLPLLRKLENEK